MLSEETVSGVDVLFCSASWYVRSFYAVTEHIDSVIYNKRFNLTCQ
jgi:hypothetical protein